MAARNRVTPLGDVEAFPLRGARSCSSPSQCLLVDNNGDALTASEPLAGSSAWTVQNLIPFSTKPLVRGSR